MKNKVLIGCPVHVSKSYCMDEFIAYLQSLTYQNAEFYFCDNSPNREMQTKLKQAGFNCGWVSPHNRGNIQRITDSANEIRGEARRIGADYLFSLECDVFPPMNNIIEILMAYNKDVIGATYHINHGENSHLMLQVPLDDSGIVFDNLISGIDIMFVDGDVKRVFSVGLGCCLIKRNVFEKIKFRYRKGIDAHHDTYFFSDCHYHKIPVYCDTGIICKHLNQKWDEIKAQKDYSA